MSLNLMHEECGKMIQLTAEKEIPLKRNLDGSFLLDAETNTVAYTNKDALHFLSATDTYPRDTQIIVPKNTQIQIQAGGECLTVSEVGAVMLGAGANATVNVLQGHPLVIMSDTKPSWYERYAPGGIHQDMVREISDINGRLFRGIVYAKAFWKRDLAKILEKGLLEKVNDSFVRWKPSLTEESLLADLKELNFSEKACRKYLNVWRNTKQKEHYRKESGKFHQSELVPETRDALLKAGLIKKFFPWSRSYFWAQYRSPEAFLKELSVADLSEKQTQEVCALWNKTNRSCFDFSGLVWEKGNITVYLHQYKTNLWNSQSSDWITNSSAYGSFAGSPVLGVSTVVSDKEYRDPTPFTVIRSEEHLHHHPDNEGESMKEVYFVTSGKFAMTTIRNGKPVIHVARKGDIAMITPGMCHCIMAFSGDYEHYVLQVPSTFQYGYRFKVVDNCENFSTSEKEILEASLEALRKD